MVVCGHLRWFVLVWGGLRWFAVVCLIVIPLPGTSFISLYLVGSMLNLGPGDPGQNNIICIPGAAGGVSPIDTIILYNYQTPLTNTPVAPIVVNHLDCAK